jgi:hypothetical protein
MPRHSVVRAPLLVLAAALLWTTVTPAEAKRPQRHEGPVLLNWTNCLNGAKFTIGAPVERVRLVVTSGASVFPLARVRRLKLREHPHEVSALDDPEPGMIVSDNPDTDPDPAVAIPDNGTREPDGRIVLEPFPLAYAATVKIFWRGLAGQTLNLGLNSADDPSEPSPITYRVDNCVQLPSSLDALRSWLWKFRPFSYGLR